MTYNFLKLHLDIVGGQDPVTLIRINCSGLGEDHLRFKEAEQKSIRMNLSLTIH